MTVLAPAPAPQDADNKTVELTPLQLAGAKRLAEVRRQLAQLKKEDAELTEVIKLAIPDADSAVDPRTGKVVLTFTERDGQRRTDYDLLKARDPGLYAETVSQGPAVRVMHVKR